MAVGSSGVRAPMIGMFSRSSVVVSDCSGILRQQEIAVGGLRIEPVVGAEGNVRTDAGDHVHDHAILGDAVVGGLRPIHVDVQFGIALALLDPHIDRVGHLRDFLLNLFRHRSNDVERWAL